MEVNSLIAEPGSGVYQPRLAIRRFVRPLMLAVAVAASYVVLLSAYTAAYMVNDDVVMFSIANGEYTGEPDPGLVFIGTPIAYLLVGLYSTVGDVPWYAVMLYGLQIFGVWSIICVMWVRRASLGWPATILSLGALWVFVPLIALAPTFTSTAFLACLALVIAIAGLGSARWAVGWGITGLVLLAILAVASASLRWESFVGSLSLALPLLIVWCWRAPRLNLIRVLTVSVGAGLLVLGLNAVAGPGNGWSEFNAFNEVRGQLHATSRLQTVVESGSDQTIVDMLQANNWELDDVYMLGAWFYDDPQTYDIRKISRLFDASGEARELSFTAGWETLATQRAWFLIFVLLCFCTGALGGTYRAWALNSIQLLWAGTVLIYISMTQRFPDRVAHPAFLGMALLLVLGPHLVLSDRRVDKSNVRRVRRLVPGVVTGLVTFGIVFGPIRDRYAPYLVSVVNEGRIAALDSQVEALKRVDPSGRFVFAGDAVEVEGASPWRRQDPFLSSQVVGLGWPTFSPPFEERKRGLGLTGDLMISAVVQDDVYFVLRPGLVELVERTYERRLGLDIVIYSVGAMPNGAEIYAVRSGTGPKAIAVTPG